RCRWWRGWRPWPWDIGSGGCCERGGAWGAAAAVPLRRARPVRRSTPRCRGDGRLRAARGLGGGASAGGRGVRGEPGDADGQASLAVGRRAARGGGGGGEGKDRSAGGGGGRTRAHRHTHHYCRWGGCAGGRVSGGCGAGDHLGAEDGWRVA